MTTRNTMTTKIVIRWNYVPIHLLCMTLLFYPGMAEFDWGSNNNEAPSCSGSGTFEREISAGSQVWVGDIPANLEGVRIDLSSPGDVDIQLFDRNDGTAIVAWPNGMLRGPFQATTTYGGDSITYSGYRGDGVNFGNEFIQFNDVTDRPYTMTTYGYATGLAQVTYRWSGQEGCVENHVPKPQGSGSFNHSISRGSSVTVGDLPAGLADVYIRLESSSDLDIQLYDGNRAIVDWAEGMVIGSQPGFSTGAYAGVEIQYSGYNGEQREGSYGQEYIFIKGTLPTKLTLKVLGYTAGTAQVYYNWGYYNGMANNKSSDTETLKGRIHDLIHDHIEYSYGECWDLLKRTDQDPANAENVVLLYSQKSVPKSSQDNGTGGNLWNREHVWPQSRGDFGTRKGAGTDLHALRAADASVNADRSAKDFDTGGFPLTGPGSAQDCPLCLEDDDSFEPPDEVKGDVARAIFYMAVRYNGDAGSNGVKLRVTDYAAVPFGEHSAIGGNNKNEGQMGKLTTLKRWHANDPPSDVEKHRNNLIFDIQGNRNPFIDHPEWVNLVFSS